MTKNKKPFFQKIKDLLLSERGGKSTGMFANFGISEEREYFIENLAMLISSGMSILSAIDAIRAEMRSTRMRHALTDIRDDVDAGFTIWRALDRTKLVKPHVISLIRIGEEAGRLTENLKVVVAQQRKDSSFRSKLRSAMMYPILVLVVTLVVGIGIAWFILPRLTNVFSSMHLELPLFTRILIWVGTVLQSYGIIIIPVFLVVLFVLGYYIFIYPKTKFIGEIILAHIPGVKTLIMQVEVSRFCYVLGTLLNSGMPVVESLNSLKDATTSIMYGKFYSYLRESIEEGRTFQQSFGTYPKSIKIVPRPVQQMIIAAENSGTLADTLIRVSEIFEEKTETTTKNLSVIMEPMLLFIVWGGVVGVALAVIMPIYSLIGGLNKAKTAPAKPPVSQPVPTASGTPGGHSLPVTEAPATAPAQPVLLVEILETPEGSLNVRSAPGVDGNVVARVYAGEVYEYQEEQNGWYKIILLDGSTGWVFGNYASPTQ
ncbi:MAG: type II secretion system F family protein [bacterium]